MDLTLAAPRPPTASRARRFDIGGILTAIAILAAGFVLAETSSALFDPRIGLLRDSVHAAPLGKSATGSTNSPPVALAPHASALS